MIELPLQTSWAALAALFLLSFLLLSFLVDNDHDRQ